MKKIILWFLAFTVFFGSKYYVSASNYAHAYGYGYTVNAEIYSSYFEGSVTGSYSGGSTIVLYGWYYNSNHIYVNAGSASASVYKHWNKPAIAVSWGKGYAKGIVADGGSRTTDYVYID